MARPAKALIDLDALRYNLRLASDLSPDSKVMAVIKADAYGHGALGISKALCDEVSAFGVASIEEAIELREGGIKTPIHLLEGTFSDDEIITASENSFSVSCVNQRQKIAILKADITSPIDVWIFVDTGMHRLGIALEELKSTYEELNSSSNVTDNIVVATHFSCADDLENDFTSIQFSRMTKAMDDISVVKSFCNSAGLIGWPQTRSDWNRLGIILYGGSPLPLPKFETKKLKQVMTLKSEIIALRTIKAGDSVGYAATWIASRETIIATVAIGYGDGYPLNATNGTPVLIRGERCPLAGRVSMDMITVDVTDLSSVELGDEVILWGADLSADEIANYSGTISYELFTRMPARTKRIYIKGDTR
jgi:alanine racemase